MTQARSRVPTHLQYHARACLACALVQLGMGCRDRAAEPGGSTAIAQAAPSASGGRSPNHLAPSSPAQSSEQLTASEPWGGLEVRTFGPPLDRAQRAVVLMHGYGARGDDLMPLGRRLNAGEQAAFVFPAAPFPLPNGGRAWFKRDRSNLLEGYQRARAFIAALKQQHPGLPIVIGGFSQGAIMTSNLLAEDAQGVLAAIMLSPADSLQQLPDQHSPRVPLFISHGRQDNVLPFSGAEQLSRRFRETGYPVTWFPFEGRHSIPQSVVDAVNAFLARVIGGQSGGESAEPAQSRSWGDTAGQPE